MNFLVLLCLIFTGVFVLLLIAELALRIFFKTRIRRPPDHHSGDGKSYLDAYDDPDQGLKFPPWIEPEIDYNTYLGFIPTADVTTSSYSTNRHHFRYGENFPIDKEPNEIRVFVTGGSKAWGAGVTQSSLYTTIVEKKLAARHPDKLVRVICAAGPAYCSTQERIMIENVVLRLNPDYVVMFTGRNDCYFAYAGKDTLFDEDYFDYARILYPDKYFGAGASSHERYALKLQFLFDRFFRPSDDKSQTQSRGVDLVFNTFFTNVHIVSDISKRYHFKLIVYLEPSIFTTEKPLSEWEQSVLARSSQRFPNLPEYSREIHSILKQKLPTDAIDNDYLFIDGDNAIKNELRSVFSDNVHFGDRGYRLTADHLVQILETTLPARPR